MLAGKRYQEGGCYEHNGAGLLLPWSLNEGEEFLRHPEAKTQLIIEEEGTRAFHISIAIRIRMLIVRLSLWETLVQADFLVQRNAP